MVLVVDTTHTTQAEHPTADEISRAHVIAGHARCDVRTALRAIRHGVGVIRTRVVREAVAKALDEGSK
jgi:hypothetical protein